MLQLPDRFKLLLLPLLLLTAGTAAAGNETRWYDVEVILFVQKSQSYRDSEVWPVDYTLPDTANARELSPPSKGSTTTKKPVAFRELGPDELKQNEDAERVDKASDLELLTHFGWRQPGLPDDKAVAVKVVIPAKQEESDKTAAATTMGKPSDNAKTLPPRLEGTLTLILSRYLHIDADLLYREPLGSEATRAGATSGDMPMGDNPLATRVPTQQHQDLFMLAEQGSGEHQPLYRVYRMQESRRMRSGELHYLDHPVFGLAVRVTPYEPPTADGSEKGPQ